LNSLTCVLIVQVINSHYAITMILYIYYVKCELGSQ